MTLFIIIVFIELLIMLSHKKKIEEAFVDTTLCVIGIVYVSTEVFSLIHMINAITIRLFWGMLSIGLFIVIKCKQYKIEVVNVIKGFLLEKEYCIINSFFFLWCLLIAGLSVLSVTSNWDSMTYHMPRVMHWIQNQSVDYYATNIDRQVTSPVLAEYGIMHVFLLSGHDRWVCCVQGACYLLAVPLVYILSKRLKMEKKYRYLACFLFMTMPPAIAEAFTTQNDLVAMLILLLFFWYYLEFIYAKHIERKREWLILAFKFGTVVALGFLVKANILIIMFMMTIVLAVKRLYNRDKIISLFCVAGVGILSAVMCVLPSFYRSDSVYGSLIPGSQVESVSVKTTELTLLIGNCYKNIAKYMVTPWIPRFNDILYKIGNWIEYIFKIDLCDPAITAEFSLPSELDVYSHDSAPNSTIIFMCIFIILIIASNYKKLFWKVEIAIFFSALAGFIITCTISKWSPWKVRYFLPVSVVLGVLGCYVLDKWKTKIYIKRTIIGVLILLSIGNGCSALYYNFGQVKDAFMADYYANTGYYIQRGNSWQYKAILEEINNQKYTQIGLWIGGDSYEYPLWEGINNLEEMNHVFVQDDKLKILEKRNFHPECIVAIESNQPYIGDSMIYNGKEYICNWLYEDGQRYGIYARQEKY